MLISVVNEETGQARTVCTNANFVLGAIMREYALGHEAALDVALKNEGHVFRFRQQAALANIPSRYSESDLSAARAFLAPLSADELEARFSTLTRGSRLDTVGYARDAVACALIERGFSPRLADISRQVYVDP